MPKKFLLLVLVLCSFSVMAQKKTPKPEPLKEADGPTIGYKTVAEALAAVRQDPAARVLAEGDWTVVRVGSPSEGSFVLWNFSPSTYPAYPAAVKRTIYEREGQVVIDMDVACEAAKRACEKLVREFIAVNENMRRGLNQAPKR